MKDNMKKDYIWNGIGSGIYAMSAVVLAFLAMHYAGPEDGGIFGFGFSTFGQQMFIVAYFGIRPFHITDVKHEYSYGTYRRLRIWTAAAAAGFALLYLLAMYLFGSYSPRKVLIIFLLALYKVADGIGDLYESECQRGGKLWLGGQELAARTVFSVAVFAACLLLKGDLLLASAAAVGAQAVSLAVFRGIMRAQIPGTGDDKPASGEKDTAVTLMKNTLLLFLSVFVDFYIFSASKYAIDFYMTDADSGIFNILFMPTSVIYLAANFIIKPYLTRMADVYQARDYERFRKAGRVLSGYILILSVLALAGTLVIGRYVLMLFEALLGGSYRGELLVHHWDFVMIIAGGCCYAMTNLYYYILVIMRQQKMVFYNYVFMSVVAFVLTRRAVTGFGLEGAATSYALYMILVMFVFIQSTRKQLRKEKEELEEENRKN